MDWISEVFTGTPDFVTRDCCGQWSEGWKSSYILASAITCFAYCVISVEVFLYSFIRFSYERVFSRIANTVTNFSLFFVGVTFLFCGLGHLIENVGAFGWPAYRFFTCWHWVTAILGVFTASLGPYEFFKGTQRGWQ